ncbi:unnamed protein product [Zymoseptoria tritici ST99CH_1E4]|uniref:Uncharacterized protein n=1 Tax=Zymoseptoria tritici ST99CH_1E4 TaxID=1276532 RepID=A0A2H1GTG3_ZYMTR|nr:unnamed protein product [Zymoseptoria tritici ST99CH_1E4]
MHEAGRTLLGELHSQIFVTTDRLRTSGKTFSALATGWTSAARSAASELHSMAELPSGRSTPLDLFGSSFGFPLSDREVMVQTRFKKYVDLVLQDVDDVVHALERSSQGLAELQAMLLRLAKLFIGKRQMPSKPDVAGSESDRHLAFWGAVLSPNRRRIPRFDTTVETLAEFSREVFSAIKTTNEELKGMRRMREAVIGQTQIRNAQTRRWWKQTSPYTWTPTADSLILTAARLNESIAYMQRERDSAENMDEQLLAEWRGRKSMLDDTVNRRATSLRRRSRAQSLRRRQSLATEHLEDSIRKPTLSKERSPTRFTTTKLANLKKKLYAQKWPLAFAFVLILGIFIWSLLPRQYVSYARQQEILCSNPKTRHQYFSCRDWKPGPEVHPHFNWIGESDGNLALAYRSSANRAARPDKIRVAYSELKSLVNHLSKLDPSKQNKERKLSIEFSKIVDNTTRSMQKTAASFSHLLDGAILTHAGAAEKIKRIETRLRSSKKSHWIPGSERRTVDALTKEIQDIFKPYQARMDQKVEEVMAFHNLTSQSIAELQDFLPRMMSVFSSVEPLPRPDPTDPTATLGSYRLPDGTVLLEEDRQRQYWDAVLAPYKANITDFEGTVRRCAHFSSDLIGDARDTLFDYDILKRARRNYSLYNEATSVDEWKLTEKTLARTVEMLNERVVQLEKDKEEMKIRERVEMARHEEILEGKRERAAMEQYYQEKADRKKARKWFGFF